MPLKTSPTIGVGALLAFLRDCDDRDEGTDAIDWTFLRVLVVRRVSELEVDSSYPSTRDSGGQAYAPLPSLVDETSCRPVGGMDCSDIHPTSTMVS